MSNGAHFKVTGKVQLNVKNLRMGNDIPQKPATSDDDSKPSAFVIETDSLPFTHAASVVHNMHKDMHKNYRSKIIMRPIATRSPPSCSSVKCPSNLVYDRDSVLKAAKPYRDGSYSKSTVTRQRTNGDDCGLQGKGTVCNHRQQLLKLLDEVTHVPLKPHQRMEITRNYLIPKRSCSVKFTKTRSKDWTITSDNLFVGGYVYRGTPQSATSTPVNSMEGLVSQV
ncbi:hypothetical protein T265_12039 [Opisthorchis viverrini]|uniref:Uncharacterized protein n=1 Tax=Opisthorchis viverrini TaxID=6198 RepID=A0A074Z0N3_OPIVI|nr:hypothetical protein T265_12039 [Opisthorchis viverrini]KER19032.1 hypothetical protein T265_12039 [Opisthorchis viverrini]